MKTGKTYTYKVKAYKLADGKKVYSPVSDMAYTAPKLAVPSFKLKAGTRTITVTWSKVNGADGYKIYRATSKNGTYKVIRTASSKDTRSYTSRGLTKNKTYYYKMKAYRVVDGKRVYSNYTYKAAVKVK